MQPIDVTPVRSDVEIAGFERGIDRDNPRTRVPKGGYDDAVNMLLTGSASGRTLGTVFGDAKLDALVTWPAGNPTFISPFTYSTYDSVKKSLTFATHLLIARDTGQIIRFDPSSDAKVAGTWTSVRRGFVADAPLTPFVYDKWLCLSNGRDAPMKYGQHFLWNGQLEATPYMFPLGSRPISPLDGNIQGEAWTHQSGSGNTFAPDLKVAQGARVGSNALRLSNNKNSFVLFKAADQTTNKSVDYTLAPQPYGGDTLAVTDYLVVSFVAALGGRKTSTGTVTIKFHKDVSATRFSTFTFTPGVNSDAWKTFAVLRSTGVAAGGFVATDWSSIGKITFTNNDKSVDIFVDDFYWLYANAPAGFAVGVSHKTRIVGGGAPVLATPGEPALSTLVYSDAGHPDNYPAANFQLMSGGFNSLAQAAAINCLREFGDQVIVGCPQAIFAWTIGDSGNPVKSTVSTEHGIDTQRGVVETPQGSLIFPWQHGLYILRPTGRQLISPKIQPFVDTIDLTDPSWTVAVVDESTKTIRIAWRTSPTAGMTGQGVIYDYVRSQQQSDPVFASRFTQLFDYAVEAIINGNRRTLYCKANDAQVYVMGSTRNAVGGSWTSPWMEREHGDKLTKWLGVAVPYAADSPVTVDVRFANTPGQFETAKFEQDNVLEANPPIDAEARVNFAGSAKWMQIRLTSAGYFEIYPPIVPYGVKTERAN